MSPSKMRGFFGSADAFNQPIQTWNVSSLRDATGMFMSNDSFNQDLCIWHKDEPSMKRFDKPPTF